MEEAMNDRGAVGRTDIPALLQLTGRGAHLVLLLYLVSWTVLAITAGGDPMRTWEGGVALALVMAVSVLTVRPDRYPLRLSWTIAIVLAVAISTVLISWQLQTDGGWPGYNSWYVGANTYVLLALWLRGRYGWAWGGMAAMIVLTVYWSVATGQGILHGVSLVDKEAGLLIIGTFFAIGLGRTARRILEFNEAESTRIAEEQGARAAAEERNRQVDRLQNIAGQALAVIAAGGGSTSNERSDYLALEATLRDSVRARSFAIEPLISAATEARKRGLEVLLLDDVDQLIALDKRQEIAGWVSSLLDAAQHGKFTARFGATRDGLAVTVVTSSDDRRHELRLDETANSPHAPT